MKAIQVHQFGDPSVMQLEDVADLQPGPGEVVVQIHAAGVNPVDSYIRSGQYARKPELPYTPGIDGAGTVLAVGDGVGQWQGGDRVYGGWPRTGTYAEMALYTADQLYTLPLQISFKQGAGLFVPYSTAYRALWIKGAAKPGEWVLIHGATGAVGLAATQLAVAAGMGVIGTGGSETGREQVRSQGAHHVLDHHSPDYLDEIRDITSGSGVNVILEMLANVNLSDDLALLAPHGRVVIIGSRGPVEINPRDIMGREAIVTGLTLFNTPAAEMDQIQAAIQAGLRTGTLNPIVARELDLADAPQAHEQVMKPGAQGNLILVPASARPV